MVSNAQNTKNKIKQNKILLVGEQFYNGIYHPPKVYDEMNALIQLSLVMSAITIEECDNKNCITHVHLLLHSCDAHCMSEWTSKATH
jgi:hypothetical protein